MIRGTPSTITQRQTQPVLQQSHLDINQLRSSSTALASQEDKDTTGLFSLPGQLLNEWKESRALADIVEATKRITNCFEQRLDDLDLSYLSLSTLPDVFGGMQHVQYLSIANNYFSEIPQFLTKLASLKLLTFPIMYYLKCQILSRNSNNWNSSMAKVINLKKLPKNWDVCQNFKRYGWLIIVL